MTINILIAGRSQTNIELVKAAVEQSDYQIIPAAGISLGLFLAHKNFPDLIISDVELSEGDPFELLHELRSHPELSPIPFLVLTPPQVKEQQKKALLKAGVDGLIALPITPTDLGKAIDRYVSVRLAYKEDRQQPDTSE